MTGIKPFFFSVFILHLVLGSPIPLENDVQTHRYDVKLSLLEDKRSFTGNEIVSLKAIKETSVLRLKYSNADISTVTVYDPRKPKDELVKSYNREEDNSLLINLLSPLQMDTVYIVGIEFSGTFENDMTFERLFEQKGNGNIFPCFENSESQTIYQMSISLSQDGEQNKMKSMDVHQDNGDVPEGNEDSSTQEQGSSTQAQDSSTQAQGSSTQAQDSSTQAPGSSTQAQGSSTQAQGSSTEPQGSSTQAQGSSTQEQGSSTQAQGSSTQAQGSSTTTASTTTTDSDNAASFSMVSSTLLSIVAICVISLR